MNIFKTKTAMKTEEVVIGKRCDYCGKEIEQYEPTKRSIYFDIMTGHYDWGNDSHDSIKHTDACSAECTRLAVEAYLNDKSSTTSYIEIERRAFRVRDWE